MKLLMKCRRIFLQIYVILVICIVTGLVLATVIAKPIKLTQEEIDYYTSTAEKLWYKGLESLEEDDSIHVKVYLIEKKVQVLPNNTQKESVTVYFLQTMTVYTVNEPAVNFTACFLFYGTVCGLINYGIFSLLIFKVKEKRKSRLAGDIMVDQQSSEAPLCKWGFLY